MEYLLWWDGSGKPLEERVSKAAAYYEGKTGRRPTTILLPMSEGIAGPIEGISSELRANVLPNHMMLG